ncbi:MAG: hypothetical protein ABIY39_11180 [Sphingomonas sp.]
MFRFASFAASVVALAMVTPTVASAQSGGHYVATSAGTPARTSFVTQNTVWKCKDGVCTAPRTPAQDRVMCERAASRIGALSAFSVGGVPFDAAALEACNARVK